MVAATVAVRWLLSSSGTTSTTSAPARSRPRQPRMSASAWAEVGPPTSGVPTAGANPGSTKSTSTVTNALRVADRLDRAGHHAGAQLREVVPRHDGEAQLARLLVLVGDVEPAAHAEEGGARRVDDALLRGAADHRTVDVPLAGALFQAVRVGAEVQQRERTVLGGRRAQLGERDGVVAADAERHRPGGVHLGEHGLHRRQAAVGEAAGDRPHVAGVDHREPVEHGHALRRVVGGVDGERGLADRARPETGARAHGEARVEGQADDRDVDAVELRDVRQPQERGHSGDARRGRSAVRAVSLHRLSSPRHSALPASVLPGTASRQSCLILLPTLPIGFVRGRTKDPCVPADRPWGGKGCRTRDSEYW